MKVMIDTCVSLDYIQQREPFFEQSKRIFEIISDEKIDACISVKSFADIHYVTKHILHDENKVRMILRNLLNLVKLVNSESKDAISALDSLTIDYEDALMIETASTNKIDYIVTRNLIDYKKSRIKYISPDELIKMID